MSSKATEEAYLAKHDRWKEPLLKFRRILLNTELKETFKWGIPVFTLNGKNVVGLGAFKIYVGLWFFQGAFLKDEKKVLVNAQDGKTKGLRQMRFTSLDEIDFDLVKAYIYEAIENQKAGKEIKPETKKPIIIPDELKTALHEDSGLKSAFDQFTPGKQREFADYISTAKQASTRLKIMDIIIPMMKKGIGMNDKYRK